MKKARASKLKNRRCLEGDVLVLTINKLLFLCNNAIILCKNAMQ